MVRRSISGLSRTERAGQADGLTIYVQHLQRGREHHYSRASKQGLAATQIILKRIRPI